MIGHGLGSGGEATRKGASRASGPTPIVRGDRTVQVECPTASTVRWRRGERRRANGYASDAALRRTIPREEALVDDDDVGTGPGAPARDRRGPPERGRVRRPADLLIGVVALLGVVILLGIAHALPLGSSELTDDVARWVAAHVPRALALVFSSVADVGALVFLGVATVWLVRRGRRDGLNAGVAGFVGAGGAIAAVVVWRGAPGAVAHAMLRGTNATSFVVTVAFVAFVTGTDLVRRARWTRGCALAVGPLVLGELALNDLTIFATLTAPLAGWAAGLLVRWSLGAVSVRPSADALVAWLRSFGIAVAHLEVADGSRGFHGLLEDGTPIDVACANRDTRGSGIGQRLWRSLRVRGAARGAEALSSRSQLEREALACYVAGAAEVRVPRVLRLAEIPPETLVLCTARPEGKPLGEGATVEAFEALFGLLDRLHCAGIAHRDLRSEELLVGTDGPGFARLARAQVGAGELVRRLDLAQLLTTASRLVGPADAVAAMRAGYAALDPRDVAAVLQPVALAPWGWTAVRRASGSLTDLRGELVGKEDAPEPLRLERFRWRTVVSTVGITVAAFLLIGQLSRVDLLGALGSMNPGWFLVAVAASALTYFGAALNLAAFVPARLSMLRGWAVQLSSAFVGVAMPPTVGHVAVNSRYLHRAGVDEGSIAAAVAVSQVVNVATTVPMLVIIGVLTGSGVSRFHIVPSTNLLLGLAAIVAVVGVLFVIPATRGRISRFVWPRVRSALPRLLDAISQPLRLLVGVAGNLLLSVGYVAALLASLLALGAHPPILPVAAVYLAGNAVGSIAPTPGGLGAVEAVLSAGLTAIGIPAHEAVPAVLIFRVATFWLPIPAGWVSFTLLERSGTL